MLGAVAPTAPGHPGAAAPPRPTARAYHLVPTGVPQPAVERAGLRLDVYVPGAAPARRAPPPLFVFLVGGLWAMPDDNYAVGPALADEMQREGIATAVVRFALADGYLLERCTQDIARTIANLVARSGAFGFDGRRVVIGGHGAGGLMASLLGLDARYFAAAGGFDASRVAGVVALRGVYDLSDAALAGHPQRAFFQWAAGKEADARRQVSPRERVRAGAPPFLVLAGGDDLAGFAQDARAFARALERAGHRDVQSYVVPERDGRTLANLSGAGNHVTRLVAGFVRGEPVPEPIEGAWAVKQIWQRDPPFSSEPFWTDERLVQSRPVDDRFKRMLGRVFEKQRSELGAYPGKVYHAIDLDAWLASRGAGEIGQGEHLTITNIRGERLFLTREAIRRARPEIVVGLDDERNLFRLAVWYRLKNQYSWKPETALLPKMIRPVGAFLYYPEDPPDGLPNATYAAFGLTPDSFRLSETDPLAPVRDVPPEVWTALAGEVGCLTCHAFRGAGARSHHVRASDGKPHGGFGLALEEYPGEVWRRFLYEQKAVAETIGVGPLEVPEPGATLLHNLVTRERKRP
ncbi:MAG TPA: alpha/beta hydrolase [Methylomirabilota bacterium]|nr:alpha/beta hydrolase [Methylomirabilota bacterium]